MDNFVFKIIVISFFKVLKGEKMTYFNTKIYNSKNLKKEDRIIINYCDDMVRDLLTNAKAECEMTLSEKVSKYTGEHPSTLEKISAEERLKLIQELWESYESDRLMTIVSMIEGYEDFDLTDEEIEAGIPDELEKLK